MNIDANDGHSSNLIHSSRTSRIKIHNKTKSKKIVQDTVEGIWLAIQSEEIDITRAIVGYLYSNGIPIFSSDDLTTLLQLHGYSGDVIMDFLMDFSRVHEKNPETPILMMSKNKMQIYNNFAN